MGKYTKFMLIDTKNNVPSNVCRTKHTSVLDDFNSVSNNCRIFVSETIGKAARLKFFSPIAFRA